MARRSYRDPDLRSSIGDHYVDTACANLTQTYAKTAALMLRYEHSRESTLPMLFTPDVITRASAVRGIIEPASDNEEYEIGDATLTIRFDKDITPTIMAPNLQINHALASPLLHFIAEAKEIYMRFEEVKAVLRWMNRNATAGAVRYLFPTALQLCPDSPSLKDMQHVPTRFTNPPGVANWLPSIKNAAATVAGSLLLPSDAKMRHRDKMWLTFGGIPVALSVNDDVAVGYTTDKVTIYL